MEKGPGNTNTREGRKENTGTRGVYCAWLYYGLGKLYIAGRERIRVLMRMKGYGWRKQSSMMERMHLWGLFLRSKYKLQSLRKSESIISVNTIGVIM